MKKMYVFFMILFTGIVLFPMNLSAQCADETACNYDSDLDPDEACLDNVCCEYPADNADCEHLYRRL